MRDHLTILKDIEEYLSNHSLTDDLQSLQEEIQASATGGEICSRAGTWLLTFQVYSKYDQIVQDLIEEFIVYCHSNGIYPR